VKKLLLIFLVLFLTSFVSSVNTISHTEWILENGGQWGSFYWKVDRTIVPNNNGVYWYYLYFYSNSLLASEDQGSSGYNG